MTLPSTPFMPPTDRHPVMVFGLTLAVMLAAFLLIVGLGPDRLPFPPDSDFSDAVTSHWPNALFLRRSVLDDHTLPLWRPLIMSGQPFAANPLNKVWYPPQWLVLVLPPDLHLNLLIWLHLLLAGVGAWVWSWSEGLQSWAAALAGLGYAFSPRLIATLGGGHLDVLYAAAWIPWLLWSVRRAVQPYPAPRSALWLGGSAALCFLADVRLSAYAFALAGAYLIWYWWQTPDLWSRVAIRRVGPNLVAAGLLAAGLTAVQWVPLLLMRADLSRGGITLDDAAVNSIGWGGWLGLLLGDHGGSWETLVYGGISTLTLALVALLMRPRAVGFWWIVLVFIMLYAMGDQFVVWAALNRLIPPLRWLRVPPRIWLIAALILPYLAGWGAQVLVTQPPQRRSARLSVVALLGGGALCGLLSTLTLSSALDAAVLLGTFALPAVALVMLLAIFGKLPAPALLVLFAAVVVLDVLWTDIRLVEGRHKREWLEPYRELAAYLDDAGAVRVYSPSYSLPQQAAAEWDIAQFDGVDPFQISAYVDAAEASTGVQANGYSVTIPAYEIYTDIDTDEDLTEAEILATANRDAPIQPDLLGQWLVTHVVSAFPIQADGLALETRIGDVTVYRNTTAPDVTLTWDGPNRVTVQLNESYTGTLYAIAGGRWQDHVDDSPGLPGPVDGSAQRWAFEYSASEVWIGLLAAGVLIALAGSVWWGSIRRA
ncbi:MAG: hypothetical protein JXQ72_01705 [Anaerolineae bacterium]|nr:hypothetical protein [Anaerolineae bacterium]